MNVAGCRDPAGLFGEMESVVQCVVHDVKITHFVFTVRAR